MRPGIALTPAKEADVPATIECAAAAFASDPLMHFFFGASPMGVRAASARFFELLMRARLALRAPAIVARQEGAIVGVAMGYDTTPCEWPEEHTRGWERFEAEVPGVAERFAYSTAKGAVMAMTLSVAKDYLRDGIRCNAISPGRVHTPFVDGFLAKNYPGREAEMFEKLSQTQPIGRMARPDEVAALALYLCSAEAAFITGTDYPIDGGFITLNT